MNTELTPAQIEEMNFWASVNESIDPYEELLDEYRSNGEAFYE